MRWYASDWGWAVVQATDWSDSVESSRNVATPSGKMGIIAAVAAAAVAGGPATAENKGGSGPGKVWGNCVVLSDS